MSLYIPQDNRDRLVAMARTEMARAVRDMRCRNAQKTRLLYFNMRTAVIAMEEELDRARSVPHKTIQ